MPALSPIRYTKVMKKFAAQNRHLLVISCALISMFLFMNDSSYSSPELDTEEAEFLVLINQYRVDNLDCWNGTLMRTWRQDESRELTHSLALAVASEDHNLFMIEHACVEHQCPGEAALPERVNATGYQSWSLLLENIAAGTVLEGATSVFDGWRNSDSHNKSMLHCAIKSIGIARNFSNTSEYGWYWTTDFGDVLEE